MTPFFLGVLVVVLVDGLFALGMWLGWSARIRYEKHLESLQPEAPEPQAMTPEQMEQFRQDQEAFETMLHYSPEIAYELITDPLQELARKEK